MIETQQKNPPIETLDCNGALGLVIWDRPSNVRSGTDLVAAVYEAARKNTPSLLHPDAIIP